MPEVKSTVTEVAVAAPPAAKADPRQRADALVVTQENWNEHVDKVLGVPAAEPDVHDVEATAAADLKKLEDEKAAKKAKDAADNEEIDHPDEGKRSKLTERFSELTKARKAAEAKAAAEAAAAKAEREAREAVQAERDALKAKYEPPKSDELGPEPQPEQFTDPREYGKALKDWTADQTRREDAGKQAQAQAKADAERVQKGWQERLEATKERLPDYDEKITAATNVKISDQAREAIMRSDVGPEILYHFAANPEVADGIAKMTIGDMYYAIGKLAAELGGTLKKADATVTPGKTPAKAEISKAPPPISPLNGGSSASVVRLRGTDTVPATMTYDAWKKLREAGKIQ